MCSRTAIMILCNLLALEGIAQQVAQDQQLPLPEPSHQRPRLEAGFGQVSFPITCQRELSQLYYNQGIAMLHGFDLRGADRAFHQVAQLEPDCAMAYWGRAMANLANPNWLRPMLRRAVDRCQSVSPRERAWIDALANTMPDSLSEVPDGAQLAKAFERLASAYPKDTEAKAFYLRQVTLNHIEGEEGRYSGFVPLFDAVLATDLKHPISACRALLEEDADLEQALDWAETAVRAAPRNAHLRVVASRLYTKSGRDSEAVAATRQAVRLFGRGGNRCPPLPQPRTSVKVARVCTEVAELKITDAMLRLERLAWQTYQAKQFTLPDKEGQLRSLMDYRGKPVLLVFFLGAGCPHCFGQMQTLAPRKDDFETAGIQVVTVSTDSIEGLQQTFEIDGAKQAMPFLVLCDEQLDAFRDYGVFDEFSRRPLHGMFLIDKQGRVVWQNIGIEPFMAIQPLLMATRNVFARRSSLSESSETDE